MMLVVGLGSSIVFLWENKGKALLSKVILAALGASITIPALGIMKNSVIEQRLQIAG
jgi:hypothetical protein